MNRTTKNKDDNNGNDGTDGTDDKLPSLSPSSPLWPEDEPDRQGILTKVADHLFYSYMSKILKKGAQLHSQRKIQNDGSDDSNHGGTSNTSNSLEQEELSDEDFFI
jgi:hypothetical protein